jgi:predicted transcriptional regulator
MSESDLKSLTTTIVAAYVSANELPTGDLPGVITSVYSALASAGNAPTPTEPAVPAVPIKKSVTADYLICLEDGKKLKMLKRHLMTAYGLSPDEYRAKWGLPLDYPMVAPAYGAARSEMAKAIGLGTKPRVRKPKA